MVALPIEAVHNIELRKHLKDGLSVIILLANGIIMDLKYLKVWQFFQMVQVGNRRYSVIIQRKKVELGRGGQT